MASGHEIADRTAGARAARARRSTRCRAPRSRASGATCRRSVPRRCGRRREREVGRASARREPAGAGDPRGRRGAPSPRGARARRAAPARASVRARRRRRSRSRRRACRARCARRSRQRVDRVRGPAALDLERVDLEALVARDGAAHPLEAQRGGRDALGLALVRRRRPTGRTACARGRAPRAPPPPRAGGPRWIGLNVPPKTPSRALGSFAELGHSRSWPSP